MQSAKEASPDKFKLDDEAYENLIGGIPKNFDARKKWKKCYTIGEIRDQGKCGSCWVRYLCRRICVVEPLGHKTNLT